MDISRGTTGNKRSQFPCPGWGTGLDTEQESKWRIQGQIATWSLTRSTSGEFGSCAPSGARVVYPRYRWLHHRLISGVPPGRREARSEDLT